MKYQHKSGKAAARRDWEEFGCDLSPFAYREFSAAASLRQKFTNGQQHPGILISLDYNFHMQPSLDLPLPEIAAVCQRHHIQRLAVFGSAVRDNLRPDTDVDILVQFEADQHPTLFDMGAVQMELTEILHLEVDLKTAAFLSRHFRQQALDQAVVVYEHGRS